MPHNSPPVSLPAVRPSARVARWARRRPLGILGVGLVVGLLLTALLGPFLAPHDPLAIDETALLLPPGLQHPLGTDNMGRDVLSRLLHGAWLSLYVGLASVGLGSSVGALVGLVTGYRGGVWDALVQRVIDAMMAFPTLVLALAIIAAFGSSRETVVAAIALTQLPWASRIVRAAALSARVSPHIEAVRALGSTDLRILALHVAPACAAPLLVIASAGLGAAFVAEASLSFLGLGVPPPEPSWGGMISGSGRDYARLAPWMVVPPGLALSLAVYGFNLLGDELRDALDPRLRGR